MSLPDATFNLRNTSKCVCSRGPHRWELITLSGPGMEEFGPSAKICAKSRQNVSDKFQFVRRKIVSFVYSLYIFNHIAFLIFLVFRRNRSCCASDSAYSYTFLRSVVCHLYVICRLLHSCTLLKLFDKGPLIRDTCWVQRHIVLDGCR